MSMNKAQTGKKVTKKPVKKTTPHPNDNYKGMVDPATGKKGTIGGEGRTPPFTAEERKKMPRVGSKGSGKNGKTIKKARNGVKTIGPNKYAKEQVINKDKKKAYVATNTGTVHSIDNKRMQTIDTTGYSKGKPTYELKEKGKSKTINRKDVKPLLKNMKKNASMKTGGKMTKCKYGCK